MYTNFTISVNLGFDKEAKQMVLDLHYTKTLARGCDKVYSLYIDNKLMGVAGFGIPVGRNCQQKYSKTGKRVIELKRFVLHPDCLKNTGSWFMSKVIKELKKQSIDCILSYADPKFGHTGTIYKAMNFSYLQTQKYKTKYIKVGKKLHHARAVYQDSLTGKKVRAAMKSGKAKVVMSPNKHIYLYRLEK